MNPAAILAILSDLRMRIAQLEQELAQARAELARTTAAPGEQRS